LKKMIEKSLPATVLSISKSLLMLPAESKANGKAVLLIHGYTGSPHDMHYLGSRLQAEGYIVSIPRLPGHGTNLNDFLETKAEDWLKRAMDSWIELQDMGDGCSMAGLSMGGLIAAAIAVNHPPESLVLAAPAFLTNNSLLPWTPLLKFVVRKKRKKKEPEKYEDPDLDYLSREYWSFNTPSSAAELYALQKLARSLLPRLHCPLLTIASRKDTTVPSGVVSYLEAKSGSAKMENLILEESGHVVVNDCEKERVAGEIISFLRRNHRQD
jgi:carboxylesterase